ncbi:hypothetical protein PInf_026106 [Phytophthora infestans]|nr:hypothetical protein PInf_026106 [Phytophthora infestans]
MVAKKPAACRAEIPPMLSQEQRDAVLYTPQCRQRWGERRVTEETSVLEAEDIEEFLTEFSWLKEKELALQCFIKEAIATHGKKFHLVKQSLGEKAITCEVVSKYYLWKRTDDFKEWWRQQKTMKRRKTKKEAERLRQWADESDSDTDAFLGYHNRHCELCATGGSLLCCDGCPRAYHISCAQPPITKLRKDEDWFCSHCQEEFGGSKPKLTSSDQSEHCMTYAIPPGLQRR